MITNDDESKGRELEQDIRKYSYELTQKLTYFVISAELVFCGYMLLNTEKLKGLQSVSYLFLVSGVAALSGILWRFCYNQTYHNNAHKIPNNQSLVRLQIFIYRIYVVLSLSSLIWALIAGFNLIELATQNDISKEREHVLKKEMPVISKNGTSQISRPNLKEQKVNNQNHVCTKNQQ